MPNQLSQLDDFTDFRSIWETEGNRGTNNFLGDFSRCSGFRSRLSRKMIIRDHGVAPTCRLLTYLGDVPDSWVRFEKCERGCRAAGSGCGGQRLAAAGVYDTYSPRRPACTSSYPRRLWWGC